MLVIFKSKASGDIIMYEKNAKVILDLLNRDTKSGIIMAEETAWAIDVLEKEVEKRKAEEALEKAREKEQRELKEKEKEEGNKDKEDEREKLPKVAPVSFSARVYPFLEMLRAAHKKNREIVWGV